MVETQKLKDSVLVIILNYNGWRDTLKCVDSILKQDYKKFHILLIDNGSSDDSAKKLKKLDTNTKITLRLMPLNLGFAGGVNVGINTAISKGFGFVALINNDATLSNDWISKLINSLKTMGVSSATGLLLDLSGNIIESTGDSYSCYGFPFPRQRGEPKKNAMESGYVFGGTAGASLYKTSLFEDIGLFDEKFFAYYEDTDINFRAQLAGYKSFYDKEAIAYHNHGTTSSKIPGFTTLQTFKNLPIFLIKNLPRKFMFNTLIRFIPSLMYMYIRSIFRGNIIYSTTGLIKTIGLIPHALKERKIIQKNRRVSTSYLESIINQGLPPSFKEKISQTLIKSGRKS